ncbi:MAG: hypothetical protein EXS32_05410 [Opitutus sp.]|nr:hypothetical protein [Opitutus sp.]
MPDESEPPRKFYGFKPREFEVANPDAKTAPPPDANTAPDPGIATAPAGRIDVRELTRIATGAGAALGNNGPVNRENDVHALLREKLAHDQAAGRYGLGVLDDSKRRRRIRNYWLALVAVDVPLGGFAFWIGHGAAIPFVCAIAGIAMFTAYLTWETFFLRMHY